MGFFFFFDQYEDDKKYFDAVLSHEKQIELSDPSMFSKYEEFSVQTSEDYPVLLKITTEDKGEFLDIRLLHDYTTAIQLIYGIFQSNEKYEIYEAALAKGYFDSLRLGEKAFEKNLQIDLPELYRDLEKDYKLVCELSDTNSLFKINSGVRILSMSKSPLEIVFASSFFLLTLGVIVSGGNIKSDSTTKTLKVELASLASGLKPLLSIFKEPNKSSNDNEKKSSIQTLFDDQE